MKHSSFELAKASYRIPFADSGCDILQRACLLPSGEPGHRSSEPGPAHHRDVSGALGRHSRCVRTPHQRRGVAATRQEVATQGLVNPQDKRIFSFCLLNY